MGLAVLVAFSTDHCKSRSGSFYGQPNCFEIAHFTHQNNVRIFPQRSTQRRPEGLRVNTDFPMIDDTLLRSATGASLSGAWEAR